jgi:hypothetical protein
MGHVKGQIVFSAAPAGGYAWNGDGNGVFTKGVLEALNCKASLKDGVVTFDALRTSVERYVRKWLADHHKPLAGAATQAIVDGSSGSMPLVNCECVPPPPLNDVVRVQSEGSEVTTFGETGASLWTRTVTGPVLSAEVMDLDANGSHEVVVGADALTVFDYTGAVSWLASQEMPLHRLLIDDLLYTDITRQVVALWNDERASRSRVSVYSAEGESLSTYDHAGPLRHLAIDRETTRHTRRIIAAGDATVVLLGTKKRIWTGTLVPPTERIQLLEIIDHDRDGKRDIAISTASGRKLFLDFKGQSLVDQASAGVKFTLLKGKRGLASTAAPSHPM